MDEISDEEFRAMQETLSLERAIHADKSPEDLAEQMLLDAAPIAAQTLVKLCSAGSEGTRFRASTWILDHLSKRATAQSGGAVWDDLFEEVTVSVNK